MSAGTPHARAVGMTEMLTVTITPSPATKTHAPTIPYTPDTWTASQLAFHRSDTLEAAFHASACLTGGWYRRAVTIDYQITADNNERYMIRPAEVDVLPTWRPCYTVSCEATK